MIVRVWSRRPLFGSVKPTCPKSQNRPFASARPATRPVRDAAIADHERLDEDGAEDLAARGADRPHGGELARPLRDRDRERVRDHERADEERDPAEREQEALEEAEERLRIACILGRLSRPGAHLRAGREDLLDLPHQPLRRGARLRGCPDLIELPDLLEQLLGRSEVEGGERRAADVALAREVEEAGDPHLPCGPLPLDGDAVARRRGPSSTPCSCRSRPRRSAATCRP